MAKRDGVDSFGLLWLSMPVTVRDQMTAAMGYIIA